MAQIDEVLGDVVDRDASFRRVAEDAGLLTRRARAAPRRRSASSSPTTTAGHQPVAHPVAEERDADGGRARRSGPRSARRSSAGTAARCMPSE